MESTAAVDMSQEIFRTASFGQFPPNPVTSFEDNVNFARFPSNMKLSKAGFYRNESSSGDEVRCFACGLVLKDWSTYYGESPMSLHLCKSPTCPYLNCQNSDVLDGIRRDMTPSFSRSGSPQSSDVFLTAAESETVKRQLFPDDDNVDRNRSITLTGGQIQASIMLPFKPKFGDSSMLFESKRCATFSENPCIKAKDLASAGFVIRTRGKIVCVFCGKQTDCPTADCLTSVSELHRDLNPNCPFLRGFDLGNVSQTLENALNGNNHEHNIDTGDHDESANDSPAVSADSKLFYNPYFEDFTVRKESFRNWPPQMKPTSQQLTEAGFFYSGTFDKVTCFTCGCSLNKWQADADAMVQHAKHSPDCLYLQKLPQYHDIKQLAMETQEMTVCEMPVEDGPVTNESPVKTPSPFKTSVDPTIITNCQAALSSQFGFEVDLQVIREAICQFYAVFNSYPNYDLLVGWMLTTRKEFQLMQEMRGNIHVQEVTLENKDRQIDHHRQQIDHHRQQIEEDRQQYRQEIQHKDQEIQHKDQEIQQERQQYMQQVSNIEQYRDELSCKDDEIFRLKQQMDQKQQQLDLKDQLFDTQLKSKDNVLAGQNERIDQLEQDNIRMQNMIMHLRRELQMSTSRRG